MCRTFSLQPHPGKLLDAHSHFAEKQARHVQLSQSLTSSFGDGLNSAASERAHLDDHKLLPAAKRAGICRLLG